MDERFLKLSMGCVSAFHVRSAETSTLLPRSTYLRVDSVSYFPRWCLTTLHSIA